MFGKKQQVQYDVPCEAKAYPAAPSDSEIQFHIERRDEQRVRESARDVLNDLAQSSDDQNIQLAAACALLSNRY